MEGGCRETERILLLPLPSPVVVVAAGAAAVFIIPPLDGEKETLARDDK